jgi:beta-glucosidase
MAAHHEIALETARQGIMLLRNDGIQPIAADTTARIAVIGDHATVGVPIGAGSSAVTPPGGYAAVIRIGGPGIVGLVRNLQLLPSSPLEELRKLLPQDPAGSAGAKEGRHRPRSSSTTRRPPRWHGPTRTGLRG